MLCTSPVTRFAAFPAIFLHWLRDLFICALYFFGYFLPWKHFCKLAYFNVHWNNEFYLQLLKIICLIVTGPFEWGILALMQRFWPWQPGDKLGCLQLIELFRLFWQFYHQKNCELREIYSTLDNIVILFWKFLNQLIPQTIINLTKNTQTSETNQRRIVKEIKKM